MSELLKWTAPVARIAHVCDQCSRTIRSGETYSRHESVGDYGFETSKTCMQCVALGRDLYAAGEVGEDEFGRECHPYLPDVDWADVRSWSRLWEIRADMYQARWMKDDGTLDVYPTPIEEAP